MSDRRPSNPPQSIPPQSIPPFALSDNKILAPAGFILLFVITIIGLGYTLMPFLADIVASFVLVTMFQGTYQRVRKLVGGRKWVASAVTSLWVVLVVAIPVVLIGYSLVVEALAAFETTRHAFSTPDGAAHLFDRARNALASIGLHVSDEHVSQLTVDSASRLRDFVLQQASLALNNGVAIIVHFTIVIVIVFYLLVDGRKLKRFVFDLSPLPIEEEELLVRKFVGVSRGILVGNFVGSAAQGVLGGIAIWVVGLPAPIVWGAVMTLFAFLPIVGISLVVIPATLFLLLSGQLMAGLLFFVFCMGQALVLENVVKTKLIGAQTRMHDLLVFLTIVGGLAGFGLFGLLYGPIIAVAFLTLADLYRRTYRHRVAERLARGSFADG
jgi:predicted PurR-regulated permease PerM